MKFINDKYKKARGGYSRLLQLSCASCGSVITNYQKDGPGLLKRLYLDRMTLNYRNERYLICPNCGKELGLFFVYEKENRPAYRLFAGAIAKKIIKS